MGRRHPNHHELSSLPVELRRTSLPDGVRAWIAREAGAKVVGTLRLQGASSAAIHRVDLYDGRRLVVRRYVWPGFTDSEPEAPGREADAMSFAHAHGLAVPELIAADPTGEVVGDGVPVLLMTFAAGQPVGVPDLGRLAETAAAIHAVDADDLGHEWFPWYEAEMVTPPPLAGDRMMWDRAIVLWATARPAYRPVFVHRDFHPGNVLWSRGRLTAVVDWAAACRGPIGCDLAHCRNNLRDWGSPEIADAFVATYEALTGETFDPFWIVASHLEHSHRHWTPERLAVDEPDLARALAAIS